MQELVYELHLITCHERIMPRLAELLLSLRMHHIVFFPCWCFIWSSFPAGVSQISFFKVLP